MKTNFRYVIWLMVSILLLSCGGGSGDKKLCQVVEQNSCSIPSQNQCTYEIMEEYYYWYRQLAAIDDYSAFSSPAQTLDYLRYYPDGPDKYSYLTSESYYIDRMSNGQLLAYGLSMITDTDGRVWVRYSYQDSAAGRAGIERGDEIVSINGQTLTNITSNPDWTTIFGPSQEGYPIDMVIAKPGGTTESIHMLKTTVNINTVLHSSVIDGGAIKTGYLVFQSFLETSNAELAQVFADFKAAGVNRVILDLRYNGGGRVSVANNLASYLYKVNNTSTVFNRLTFNDKHQSKNSSYHLVPMLNALSIDQLIVITTPGTCSASEMVINGLSPYLPVKTVGGTTCGKPIGMNPFFFCGNALLPIMFEAQNSQHVGGYFDGIAADCPAEDDVTTSFADAADPMLSQALYLAGNGSCKPQAARAASKPAVTYVHKKGTGRIDEIISAY